MKKLKECREEKGLSIQELSELSRIPESWLIGYEDGSRNILKDDVMVAFSLSRGLDISPETVVKLIGEEYGYR